MIHVNGVNLSLDRKEKGADTDFISHAHSDHISSAKSSKNIITSSETADLLSCLHGISAHVGTATHEDIALLDAGHIFGSKQIAINDALNGRRIVYTGDFQMQHSRTCNAIQLTNADMVIVDSTYFDPGVRFDAREEVEPAMQLWAQRKLENGIVLFGAYALGKAQEIISIMNEVGIVPVVSKKIGRVCEVYKKYGARLDYASAYEADRDNSEAVKGNFVGIVEPHGMNELKAQLSGINSKRVFTAVATGFSKMIKFSTDVQFPLSDHADFWQTTEYIDASGARSVLTYGSNAVQLAEKLRDKGYDAAPFLKGEVLDCGVASGAENILCNRRGSPRALAVGGSYITSLL